MSPYGYSEGGVWRNYTKAKGKDEDLIALTLY